jgi:DnaJ-class molecular chaperone
MQRSQNEKKQVCNTCGGSGEIGYFQGESRFVITREECPACFGFGYVLEDEDPASEGIGDDTLNKEE